MTDNQKDWLRKVLDDASAEVKSWPRWLKDREAGDHKEEKKARAASASGDTSHQGEEKQHFGD